MFLMWLWIYSVNLVNIFTKYVNIQLEDAGGEFLVHILPDLKVFDAHHM